ncbi:Imm61 family immunity protein [Cryobacterium sp. PH29-G1]|uniref:Imm61 family immunity protein n=1 Tax=Cryobacterium sp. PH29-G1 TaxID=3046211 RepID=UPI0024B8E57B|nr:Imm61 family immunity protein [Cryobacterium sp. PH29-G1]MDJ0350042.1 Imm61 family immunity protein [Cryobacterium sp. PH29-G1]
MTDEAIELSPEFTKWVDRAEYAIAWSAPQNAVVVADVGGEIRFYIRGSREHGFRLSRAERSEPKRFVMESTDLTDIERYLAVDLADDVRQREGLAVLRVPGRVGEYADGISGCVDDGIVTIVVGHGSSIRFVKRDPYGPQPDVQFSHFATASVAEIIESALSPSGGPLFAYP